MQNEHVKQFLLISHIHLTVNNVERPTDKQNLSNEHNNQPQKGKGE